MFLANAVQSYYNIKLNKMTNVMIQVQLLRADFIVSNRKRGVIKNIQNSPDLFANFADAKLIF